MVGAAVPRKEGRAKVTGSARYAGDLRLAGMLHGVTVRSPAARGRIRELVFDPAFPWSECAVVTARDIPGENVVALIEDDQPFLAGAEVNHAGEPVALIAHPDRYMAERARTAVRVVCDELPAVLSISESDTVFREFRIERGDLHEAFGAAAFVVEGEYSTSAQEQLYIEPQGILATAAGGEITVRGSMQCPYYVHAALKRLFAIDGASIRVIQSETGGGFGGKEEYPSILAGHAALLAWKSGRPVKMIYDRAEDIFATTKRHPSRSRLRVAVSRAGALLGLDFDFDLDGGAYCTLSPVVLSRGAIHAAGPYRWPAVRVRARAWRTNYPPHGAFRGFGAPQSLFALERHIDVVARIVGVEPDELRRRNFLRQGDATATGQVIGEPVCLEGLLERALSESRWREKRERFRQENTASRVKRGMGLASFLHGAGFTGSGERRLESSVRLEAAPSGRVQVFVSSTEIGQGTNTILSQIAAEALGADVDDIEIVPPETGVVPDSGPTVASRTTMVVGKLVERAARALAERIAPFRDGRSFAEACAEAVAAEGRIEATEQYSPPPDVEWDDSTYTGSAYGTYAWAVYVAQVAVDTVTGETRVEDFVAVQDAGKVIHPVLAAGQIEGGVAQGIGWALYEDVVYDRGRVANARMTDYIMPTSSDLPPIRVFFEEHPYAHGPFGAKGIGELPMDGPAPAILNAIADAAGVNPVHVPWTPERLLEALDG